MSNVEVNPVVDDIVNHHFCNTEYRLAEQIIDLNPEYADNLQKELSMQLMLKGMNDNDQEETLDGLD